MLLIIMLACSTSGDTPSENVLLDFRKFVNIQCHLNLTSDTEGYPVSSNTSHVLENWAVLGLIFLYFLNQVSQTRMGLLPDTQNCRLRMRRECRERFPPPPISKETAI